MLDLKTLSKEKFQLARKYILEHARPLDQALFTFHFEQGAQDKVIEELLPFQNQDGGFGNAIEPDFRLPTSSPMATTIGLQYLKDIQASANEPIVKDAISYLIDSFNLDKQRWKAVPKEINDFPHAPWWNFNSEEDRCGVEETWANPSAEIVSYLNQYHLLVDRKFLEHVNNLAVDQLKLLPEKIEMHDFLCYLRLLESVEGENFEIILQKLRGSARLTVTLQPEEWSGYGARPLQIVTSPSSPFYDSLMSELELNLDYEIESMTEVGSWKPNWSWFGQYDDEWKQAESDWTGYLTVQKLLTLKKFNRIEGL